MNAGQTREEIHAEVTSTLSELFGIEAGKIQANSNLYKDLDLDSIDAVDFAVTLQQHTDRRFEPTEFASIRTVDDVVDAVYKILRETE